MIQARFCGVGLFLTHKYIMLYHTCVLTSAQLLLQATPERYDDDDDQRGSVHL